MNKLILTKIGEKTAAFGMQDHHMISAEFEADDNSGVGTIYIGKVKNVVKNLQAAFVEYKPGVNGYYSLRENQVHYFTDGKEHKSLASGDEILVQVERAAVKTKDAVLTSNISLSGRYTVFTAGKSRLGISSRIRDEEWKAQMNQMFSDLSFDPYGLILRTNAHDVDKEVIISEANGLRDHFLGLLEKARTRTPLTLLEGTNPFPIKAVKDCHFEEAGEVITDDPMIHRDLLQAFDEEIRKERLKFRLYEDDMISLASLYSIRPQLENALKKQVWLKSGGNLVIEPTEALTVIDVNTAKNAGNKDFEETAFQTNKEAAFEIAAQLRLRNISGIVIVDFIDMKDPDLRKGILHIMRGAAGTDPIPVTVVDMTPLGLCELTRKKVKKPLAEQISFDYLKKSVDIMKK